MMIWRVFVNRAFIHELIEITVSFQNLLQRLKNSEADFEDVIAYITEHYHYTPTRFANGLGADAVVNEAGQNAGACRVLALGQLLNLGEADTLQLFGRYYRDDVLKNPAGSDHANIRTFMRSGWAGVRFDGVVLVAK
jgi:hypothetical protein